MIALLHESLTPRHRELQMNFFGDFRRSRRDFLKWCAAAIPGGALVGLGTAAPVSREPARIDRYIDPLPIPQKLIPAERHNGLETYRVRMIETLHRFHSQLAPSRVWTYEGHYPGPTFEAVRGSPIVVHWENLLPSQHLFGVDETVHGAMPPAPAVRAVPHLHGARTRSESDGLPEKWFPPGSKAEYHYPNQQQAATLWYHDHALGITRLNVYAGLSGLYLLRDETERSLQLPSGEHEIPLMIQDRSFDKHGQLVYLPTFDDGSSPPPGHWAPEFFGDQPVVNGTLYPYLEVEPRPYRLRILNNANSRFFNLYLNLSPRPTDVPRLITLEQIGTDGGFLPAPVTLNKLLLGPAERADVIADFSNLNGETVTLSNDAKAPYPGWEFAAFEPPRLHELMQFRVTRPLTAPAPAFSFSGSPEFHKLTRDTSTITRDLVLTEEIDANGHSRGVRINRKGYGDPVTERVKLGALECWRFINTTMDGHPIHLHLVQFQILERQGFDTNAFAVGHLQLIGDPRPPAANESGWKDTAVVRPGEVLSILVRFEGYAGRYVYHCHMLEHEDNDMMRPYEVTF
jgi:spore coat protein A, manganese oxidase